MESVIVYTGKDLRRMREEGGCGYWTASPIRVEAAEFLVCVRNRREQWAALDYEHGMAFLIARIERARPSAHAARITIAFSSYAMLAIPDAWQVLTKGQRFPVAYLETDELLRRLNIDPNTLSWQPLHSQAEQARGAESVPSYGASSGADGRGGGVFTEAIADAKRKLAQSLGIASDKIEITIRL
jgi:hypothetical protein